jgi:ABC-2 type transport system ATP-binding protein
MSTVIQCENITHYYGKRLIYEDLNFTVAQGKILGLLGKNGTGKTTIINILNGYLKPYSGACYLFGEDMRVLTPATKARVGLLLEGHVQHSYFNIVQIEKFYSRFFPNWKSEPYWELMNRMKVTKKQKLSTMSCGQRSQVALGLILAQNPELLILDDFSMGLDPGYRRLFVDYLREYVTTTGKTVFLTSHIIQDMEKLIDEAIILDFGKILLHRSTKEITGQFRRFRFNCPHNLKVEATDDLYHPKVLNGYGEVYSFLPKQDVLAAIKKHGVLPTKIEEEHLNLEDAFIGLTGKY